MSFVFSGELSCFHCEEKHFVFRKFIECYQDNILKHTQNPQNCASRRLMIFIVDVLLPWQQQASLHCLCTPVRLRRTSGETLQVRGAFWNPGFEDSRAPSWCQGTRSTSRWCTGTRRRVSRETSVSRGVHKDVHASCRTRRRSEDSVQVIVCRRSRSPEDDPYLRATRLMRAANVQGEASD